MELILLLRHELVHLGRLSLSSDAPLLFILHFDAQVFDFPVLARNRREIGFVGLLRVPQALANVQNLFFERLVGAVCFLGARAIQAEISLQPRNVFLQIVNDAAGLAGICVADG